MKILIADQLSDIAKAALKDLGGDIVSNPDLKAEDLPGHLGDIEILIVRSTKVSAAAIDAAPKLSLIIRAGAGVNTIDLETASARGVHVANCPGKNTDAVAELAIGLLIAADRQIVAASNDLRSGAWEKKKYGKAAGLKGRTLGILGLGSIGKAVASRAKGLEMNVVAWSRSLTPEAAEQMGIGYCKSPISLAKHSDAVSVHIAANSETAHMVNAKFLDAMKDGAILVNASRGEVVDTEALKTAIDQKQLRVAFDVYEDEPAGGKADFPHTELAEMITCTPHVGASTNQAAEAIAAEAVRVVASYVETGKPVNCVNTQARSTATHNMVVTHYNRVGVLAGVLDALRSDGINIEEMENHMFDGGQAASCTLRLDGKPSNDAIGQIAAGENVIQVGLKGS